MYGFLYFQLDSSHFSAWVGSYPLMSQELLISGGCRMFLRDCARRYPCISLISKMVLQPTNKATNGTLPPHVLRSCSETPTLSPGSSAHGFAPGAIPSRRPTCASRPPSSGFRQPLHADPRPTRSWAVSKLLSKMAEENTKTPGAQELACCPGNAP